MPFFAAREFQLHLLVPSEDALDRYYGPKEIMTQLVCNAQARIREVQPGTYNRSNNTDSSEFKNTSILEASRRSSCSIIAER